MDPATWYTLVFVLLWLSRYTRLVVNIFAFTQFGARPRATTPRFVTSDITVVIPTVFSKPDEILRTLKQILACKPARVIIVTAQWKTAAVKACCEGLDRITIIGVPKLNKRIQMLTALNYVKTQITVFADDDVDFQHEAFLEHLLASFEDDKVGAAGPRQRTFRLANPNIWNFLGIGYLERRNFNTGATNYMDGGISTLSGRTQAVLTSVLKTQEFFTYFQTDSFMGRKLMVDDDKCLTRYIYSLGWKIALNFDPKCTIETTQETDKKFLEQCIRWARGHWRGNIIVMCKESYWYKTHLWTFYAIYMSQFQTPALLVDGILTWFLYCTLNPYSVSSGKSSPYSLTVCLVSYVCFAFWVLFTKVVKLIPHLMRYPQDVKFLPASIAFSYLHGIINVYALLTTYKTVWGSNHAKEQKTAPGQEIAAAPLLAQDDLMVKFGEPTGATYSS